jgi:hypothetical protein
MRPATLESHLLLVVIEDDMTAADSLILDAKQAILDEHHRRFQVLHQEGRLQEACKRFMSRWLVPWIC